MLSSRYSSYYLNKLLSGIKLSTCPLDPIPSSLIKPCLPCLTPLILYIINCSLTRCSETCHPHTDSQKT